MHVLRELAHCSPEVPGLRDVSEDREGEADEDDEEVGHRQVDDEEVRHRPHVVVLTDGDAHEQVAEQADDEDDQVERDDTPLECRREDVVADHVQVVVGANAVVVRALDVGGRVRRVAGGGEEVAVYGDVHDRHDVARAVPSADDDVGVLRPLGSLCWFCSVTAAHGAVSVRGGVAAVGVHCRARRTARGVDVSDVFARRAREREIERARCCRARRVICGQRARVARRDG